MFSRITLFLKKVPMAQVVNLLSDRPRLVLQNLRLDN